MVTKRREHLIRLLGACILPISPAAFADAQMDRRFDAKLKQALADTEAIDAARGYREGLADFADSSVERGPGAPRLPPSTRRIARRAVEMIIGFEVSSQEHYQRSLTQPVWPKGDSGVTIGIGYDLGYKQADWVRQDWAGLLPTEAIERLVKACGTKRERAGAMLSSLADIRVDWAPAQRQFSKTDLPRWVAYVLARLPQSNALSDESLGALVSLVMNRGASFNVPGDRFVEMREIRDNVANNPATVSTSIRRMVRLWQEPMVSADDARNLRGLVTRRNSEAFLFESGLERAHEGKRGIEPRPAHEPEVRR